MKKDLIKPIKSSFLSYEKDVNTILRKLFVDSKPHSDELIKLLVINTPDCLDEENSAVYNRIVSETTLSKLRKDGYIKLEPKIKMPEHEEVKAYILIAFDNFVPNSSNPQFRDCTITFDIICHTDYWDIGNYRIRPLKIAGYIDGLLDNERLSGIGTLHFMGSSELILNSELSGYTLMFQAVHGSDDQIPGEDE